MGAWAKSGEGVKAKTYKKGNGKGKGKGKGRKCQLSNVRPGKRQKAKQGRGKSKGKRGEADQKEVVPAWAADTACTPPLWLMQYRQLLLLVLTPLPTQPFSIDDKMLLRAPKWKAKYGQSHNFELELFIASGSKQASTQRKAIW